MVVYHQKNLGKCKAMYTGIQKSPNELICTIDGDGQNPPYEIKNLVEFWRKLPTVKKKNFSFVVIEKIDKTLSLRN